jgi:hypothetical protein
LWCFLERAEREEKMFPGLPKTSLHTSWVPCTRQMTLWRLSCHIIPITLVLVLGCCCHSPRSKGHWWPTQLHLYQVGLCVCAQACLQWSCQRIGSEFWTLR